MTFGWPSPSASGQGLAVPAQPSCQWCARFCLLLLRREQRTLLVDYMRRLTLTARRALEANLRDAGLHEDAPPPEDDAVVRPASTAPPAPLPLLGLPEREALVVVTAVASSMVRCSAALHTLLRRLILAHCIQGYHLDLGYSLRVYQVQRASSHILRQRHWQEETMRELLRSEGTTTLNPAVLTHVRATFGTTSHTLRFVCATQPGPRVPWPGHVPDFSGKLQRKRAVRPPKRPRSASERPQEEPVDPDDIPAHLDRLLGLVNTLTAAIPGIQDRHGGNHPVLAPGAMRDASPRSATPLRHGGCWR